MRSRHKHKTLVGRLPYLFIALCLGPAVVLTLIFIVWPTLNALYMSFTNIVSMSMRDNVRFVFLDNYIYLFTRDRFFQQSLYNTLRLVLVVPVVTVFLSLFFAFLLTQTKLAERGAYRVLFFMPSVLSMAVVSIVWASLFDPRSSGVLNRIIGFFGLRSVMWLGQEKYALWCIAFVLVWQAMGYYMVMLIAAIDGISHDIYEAADIDGASQTRKFFNITVPMLKDSIGITYVLSISGTIGLSYIVSNIMTNGGPSNATLVLLQHMYNMAFGPSTNFGYAMSITVFSLLLGFVFSFISRKFSYQNENA